MGIRQNEGCCRTPGLNEGGGVSLEGYGVDEPERMRLGLKSSHDKVFRISHTILSDTDYTSVYTWQCRVVFFQ